jgi:hypothetical protein
MAELFGPIGFVVLNIPCHAGRLTEENQFYPGQMLAPANKNKQ